MPPDSTNTTSMQLLVFVTVALLASTSASPYGSWGGSAGGALCECINPFQGTINAYRGDPDTLCGGPGFCYVACNNACSDQMQTARAAR